YFSHFFSFFFTTTATSEIYPLSLHDALPISSASASVTLSSTSIPPTAPNPGATAPRAASTRIGPSTTTVTLASSSCSATPMSPRSEEHTSELQSLAYLVCRLLLEKKKKKKKI